MFFIPPNISFLVVMQLTFIYKNTVFSFRRVLQRLNATKGFMKRGFLFYFFDFVQFPLFAEENMSNFTKVTNFGTYSVLILMPCLN